MKKLNRRGFTLVELLAVIVILAIVVGITLVTVLPTLKKSRQQAFELTAQTAADYFEKQYQLYLIGETSSAPTTLITKFGNVGSGQQALSYTEVEAAGLKPENYIYGTMQVNKTTGRVCVYLYASTNDTVKAGIYHMHGQAKAGEYYDATVNTSTTTLYVPTAEGNQSKTGTYSLAKSSGC